VNDKIENYTECKKTVWSGRIDDPADRESFRMHQIVKPLNLNKISDFNPSRSDLNICLLGFSCDEGVRRNLGREGASKGPDVIRKEFANMPVTFGNDVNLFDAGDIFCIDRDLEKAQKQLESAVKIILSRNCFPVILGGGHEIALGNYNGILKHLMENVPGKSRTGIINFDAHLDFRPFDNGGSSGSMFYQIAEDSIKNDRDFNYLCVGVQTYSNTISLFKRAESFGAEYILARDMGRENHPDIREKIDSFIRKNENIHLTLCTDVFNSAFAPGVSAPQPFGLDPEILLTFVKQVLNSGKVILFDIAEVSPRFDHDNNTAKLAAVIIYSSMNVLIESKGD